MKPPFGGLFYDVFMGGKIFPPPSQIGLSIDPLLSLPSPSSFSITLTLSVRGGGEYFPHPENVIKKPPEGGLHGSKVIRYVNEI